MSPPPREAEIPGLGTSPIPWEDMSPVEEPQSPPFRDPSVHWGPPNVVYLRTKGGPKSGTPIDPLCPCPLPSGTPQMCPLWDPPNLPLQPPPPRTLQVPQLGVPPQLPPRPTPHLGSLQGSPLPNFPPNSHFGAPPPLPGHPCPFLWGSLQHLLCFFSLFFSFFNSGGRGKGGCGLGRGGTPISRALGGGPEGHPGRGCRAVFWGGLIAVSFLSLFLSVVFPFFLVFFFFLFIPFTFSLFSFL